MLQIIDTLNFKGKARCVVCFKLPVEAITPEFRKELVTVLQEHSGAIRLNIKMIDRDNQIVVDFFSRSFRVSMNPGLVDFLDRNGIAYSF